MGEFSSAELTFCADSYSVSVLALCYSSSMQKTPVILPKVQWQVTAKHTYTIDPSKLEWADCCPGIAWEPLRETSSDATCHRMLGQSSQLAEPLWTDHNLNKWNWCVWDDFHLKRGRNKSAGWESFYKPSLKSLYVRKEPQPAERDVSQWTTVELNKSLSSLMRPWERLEITKPF